jgi:hypothetical protein
MAMTPVNILQMQSSCGTVEPARTTALGGGRLNLVLNTADIMITKYNLPKFQNFAWQRHQQ